MGLLRMKSQLIVQGQASLSILADKFHSHDIRNVLIVTGNKSFEASGAENILLPLFNSDFSLTVYKTSLKLVDVEDVKLCLKQVRKVKPDAIIAVGGGSVIDLAKVTMLCCALDIDPSVVVDKKEIALPSSIPLFAALPTTAGSGSESTHFAVLYRNGLKYSVANSMLLPDIVVLVPELILSVPKEIAIAAGLDAFAQAVESFWSVNSTNESKKLSSEALELLLPNLEKAITESDVEAYAKVQLAANYAGQAINITKTTASHALSYPLTVHFGIQHGVAVFLTLSAVYRFNSEVTDLDCTDERGAEYVISTLDRLTSLLGVESVSEGVAVLNSYLKKLGLSAKLSEYGVETNDIYDVILPEVNVERMQNNPRRINKEDIIRIMESVL